LEVRSIEIIGNIFISYIIVLFGVKVTLLMSVTIYFACCLLIFWIHNTAILYLCVIIFGILDQFIWILTTYVISCLYPIRTNLLISSCFTGISFSIFIWANFATMYINQENISLSFIFENKRLDPDLEILFHNRICNFFFYHSLIMVALFLLIVFRFNIDETSKIDLGLILHNFCQKTFLKWFCFKNISKTQTLKMPPSNKYKVNSLLNRNLPHILSAIPFNIE